MTLNTIYEGFFGNKLDNARPMVNKGIQRQKEELIQKLINFSPITDSEWEFIDQFMDACIPTNDYEIRAVCLNAISEYGNNVPLNWLDTSKVTYMERVFRLPNEHSAFNGDVSRWDTSHVTSMSQMFRYCDNFNGDLSRWDVSNVTLMNEMFIGCKHFNGDISKWNTSSVTSMCFMFRYCSGFNQDLSGWDTSKVRMMQGMFDGCTSLDCDLSGWNVSSVRSHIMMFTNTDFPNEYKPIF